ncbi:MAG TPA: amidohydrolase family protein [Xanthomonadales bacterium]|nr:amidohydrolase family protein [Xanthomonadales bacterium]
MKSTRKNPYLHDPDGQRLPIKLDKTTNGEYLPVELPEQVIWSQQTAQKWAGENAKRCGLGRRDFLVSLSGAATCLLAMNRANAAAGQTGGAFALPQDAALDNELATSVLGKKEFIFDIQTHHFNPVDSWTEATPWSEAIRETAESTGCNILPDHEFGHLSCTDARAFVREIFLDSDTDAGVLTFVPTSESAMPLSHEQANATQQIVNALPGGQRLLLHGRVIPNLPGDLERMDELQEKWDIAAWKTYTQYGTDHNSGWWLNDDGAGRAFLEKVRASGVKTISCHKGLPLPFPLMGESNLEYRFCPDVGPAAAEYPDINFIIFHSGYDPTLKEGPFVPGVRHSGSDSLVQTVLDAGLGQGSNVYAELGSTWWEVMKRPDEAAHLLGKLLKYLGEDNVLWGTDCLFYGSPQDQIQAFRTFQISEEFQERFGYPAITDEMRAKIFGLSSARIYGIEPITKKQSLAADAVGRAKAEYVQSPDPTFRTYGPRTRREFFALARSGH